MGSWQYLSAPGWLANLFFARWIAAKVTNTCPAATANSAARRFVYLFSFIFSVYRPPAFTSRICIPNVSDSTREFSTFPFSPAAST